MNVAELVEKLKAMPQDAEVYHSNFDGFLDEKLERVKSITDFEAADVFGVDCEYKRVYNWAVRQGKWVMYTGVFFEVD